MKSLKISKRALTILLVFSIMVSIFNAYQFYSLKQFIYKEYIMFFSNTVLSMDMEFLGNKDMTSNELRDAIYKYNNIVNNDIVNKNSFYKNYSKIDPNFKKLYQKQFSLLLRLGNVSNDKYTDKQICATRQLVSKITKKTSQNKDIVKIRKGQTVKVPKDIYLLFQDIDSTIEITNEKNQLY